MAYIYPCFQGSLGEALHNRPYHVHFVKESGELLSSVEEICEQMQNIEISPHLYETGFDLMKKMGYIGDGSLGKGKGIIEPLTT